MSGKLISHIVHYFISKKWVFYGILTLVISLLVAGSLRLTIKEDLYSIFPDSERFSKFNSIIKNSALSGQIYFSIRSTGDDDQDLSMLDSISAQLEQSFGGRLTDISYQKSVNERELVAYLQQEAALSLDPEDYARIDQKLNADSIRKALEKSAQRLQGSGVIFMKDILSRDPLGLLNDHLRRLNPFGNSGQFYVKDGVVYTKNDNRIIFFARSGVDFTNTPQLELLRDDLYAFIEGVNREYPEVGMDYFSTFLITVENSLQIKRDSFLTSAICIGLILILLIVYYKSFRAPFYFILPAAFGLLSGLGITGFIRPEISAISLATASVLFGIVLDYTFHFFTHLRHSGKVLDTVTEVSFPMIVGSFTTMAALAALLYTESVILQDFGLLALGTLSGSIVFTILFLPVLVSHTRLSIPPEKEVSAERPVRVSRFRLLIYLTTVVGGIILFIRTDTPFDSDLNNLAFHSSELKEKEKLFTGIDPTGSKRFYVICSSDSDEEARRINSSVYYTLSGFANDSSISEMLSLAPFLPEESRVRDASRVWKQFWGTRKDTTRQRILDQSAQLNFSSKAFSPFFTWIDSSAFDLKAGESLAPELGLDKLQFTEDGHHTYITSVQADRAHLDEVKNAVRGIEGAYILDVSEMAESMLDSVRDDMNFLLAVSALIVFISLLVVYGRIEIALFAFFPLVLSWIWILGLTGLFDLRFNFVNILVVTFIFGLGDDFSIFTTDGLLRKYKTGKSNLTSYRTAIILSGVSTIIGTGVLIFARHPAIHSIALISVIGLSAIMFIALSIQPYLFEWLVFRRYRNKRGPLTLFTWTYSILLFLYFGLGSILLNLLLLFVVLPLPVSRERKRYWLNVIISRLAKSTLYAGIHVRKRIVNPEKFDPSRPRILVSNHSSFLDILMLLMLHPRVLIMVKSWVYHSPVFGFLIRYVGYPHAREGSVEDMDAIRKLIEQGYSLAIMPEGTRSDDGNLRRFHKGAFYIARELNLEVQPILLIGAHEVNPKNDIMINRGELTVKILDPMNPFDYSDYGQHAKATRRLMGLEMDRAKNELAKTDFWYHSVIRNYVFKGPVIEWYVRIKWRLEKVNFEFYDTLIGDRKHILDLGCGYGYLDYYLHYRNSEREITAADYDEDKILIASNGIMNSPCLKFICQDIRETEIQKTDVVILSDTMHYLPKNDQYQLLDRILSGLNKGGLILIREGMKESSTKFALTRLSELLSTQIIRFNKVSQSLEFFTREEFKTFASQNGLTMETYDHSKTTSNTLIVLRKD